MILVFTYDFIFFFFQAEDGIRDLYVTGVQTCALPICGRDRHEAGHDRHVVPWQRVVEHRLGPERIVHPVLEADQHLRSEEHTSELQSRRDLVCRLLLEKKKKNSPTKTPALCLICTTAC